ncbi:methyltransferase domain-containing protein [Candidatus Thorarchaeota archaeon]|nr:MAG: methyltransferase domain-containing protein [Candidatus Thorarchaeota archaeon]
MPRPRHWYDDDEMWMTFQSSMFNQERMESTPEEVTNLIELLAIEDGNTILDLCCGIGRHTLEFARCGFTVVGVDRTKQYVETARKTAQDEGLDVEFVVDDMRTFTREAAFDAILSMYTSFGYFDAHEEQMRVLRNVYSSLKPGGRFVYQSMGKEVLARIFLPNNWSETEDGFHLERREVSEDWSKMSNKWHYIRRDDGAIRSWNVEHWIYSAAEFKRMLADTGFSEAKVYGDLDGSPYDHKAHCLIAVGIR